MWGWLLPHRRHSDLLPADQMKALREAILASPYLADTDLNEGFTGTRGFSVMLRRSALERLLELLPAARPYLDAILVPETNALFLNPLVISQGAGVAPHCDKTLVSFTEPLDPPFPFRVSVLYLRVPPGCRGGELVLHRLFLRARVRPRENLLVEFPGWLRHEVTRFVSPEPRISLVCEQYALSAKLLERVPELFLDTTRPFQEFLEAAIRPPGNSTGPARPGRPGRPAGGRAIRRRGCRSRTRQTP